MILFKQIQGGYRCLDGAEIRVAMKSVKAQQTLHSPGLADGCRSGDHSGASHKPSTRTWFLGIGSWVYFISFIITF